MESDMDQGSNAFHRMTISNDPTSSELSSVDFSPTAEEDSFLPNLVNPSRLSDIMAYPPRSDPFLSRAIYKLRPEIRFSLSQADMTQRSFIYLLGAMAVVQNRRRLIEGFSHLLEAGHHPRVCREALYFLRNYTCSKTGDRSHGVVCAAKIPDSFPELTALIFVRSARQVTAMQLVSQPWMASVHLCRAGRRRNKAAFRQRWILVNRLDRLEGEASVLCDRVYMMMERNRMRLIDSQGMQVGTGEYTMRAIEEYIEMIQNSRRNPESDVIANGAVSGVLGASGRRVIR